MFSLFLDVITEATQIIVIWLKVQRQLTFFFVSADRANIHRCSCIIVRFYLDERYKRVCLIYPWLWINPWRLWGKGKVCKTTQQPNTNTNTNKMNLIEVRQLKEAPEGEEEVLCHPQPSAGGSDSSSGLRQEPWPPEPSVGGHASQGQQRNPLRYSGKVPCWRWDGHIQASLRLPVGVVHPGKPGGLVLWPLELPRRQWRRWWLRKKGEAEIAAKKKEVENEIASRMKESEVMRNVYNGFYGLLFDCFTWECTERHVGHELSTATVPGQKYTTELPVCKQWSDQLLPPAMDLPTSTNYIFLFCHAMPILNLWHDSGNHQY